MKMLRNLSWTGGMNASAGPCFPDDGHFLNSACFFFVFRAVTLGLYYSQPMMCNALEQNILIANLVGKDIFEQS